MILTTAMESASRSSVVHVSKPRPKSRVKRYEEIARVPSAHRQRQGKQPSLQSRQLVTASRLAEAPIQRRKDGTDAVADEL